MVWDKQERGQATPTLLVTIRSWGFILRSNGKAPDGVQEARGTMQRPLVGVKGQHWKLADPLGGCCNSPGRTRKQR